MSNNNDIITMPGDSINDSMQTIITDPVTLTNLANQHINTLATIPNVDINSSPGIINGFNIIMESTPLKVGCCMRTQSDNTAKSVLVRVPPTTTGKTFNWQILSIPAGTCPTNIYQGSVDCDTFYDIYCANINKAFLDIYGANFSSSDYVSFAPECACYAPRTMGEKQYPPGIPPACYKTSCSIGGSACYPDPISRSQPCDLTICSSIINTAGMQAGGDATVTPTVTQQCGSSAGTSQEQIGDSGPYSTINPYVNYPTTSYSLTGCCCCIILIIIIFYLMKKPERYRRR